MYLLSLLFPIDASCHVWCCRFPFTPLFYSSKLINIKYFSVFNNINYYFYSVFQKISPKTSIPFAHFPRNLPWENIENNEQRMKNLSWKNFPKIRKNSARTFQPSEKQLKKNEKRKGKGIHHIVLTRISWPQ